MNIFSRILQTPIPDTIRIIADHPLFFREIDIKIAYLNCLSLIITADFNEHPAEIEYLNLLIRSLNIPEDKMNYLMEFARTKDQETLEDSVQILKNSNMINPLLLDMVIMSYRDNNLTSEEISLISSLLMKWDKPSVALDIMKNIYQLLLAGDADSIEALFETNQLISREDIDHAVMYYDLPSLVERHRVKQAELKTIAETNSAEEKKKASENQKTARGCINLPSVLSGGYYRDVEINEANVSKGTGSITFENCLITKCTISIDFKEHLISFINCEIVDSVIRSGRFGTMNIDKSIFTRTKLNKLIHPGDSIKITNSVFTDGKSIKSCSSGYKSCVTIAAISDESLIEINNNKFIFTNKGGYYTYAVIINRHKRAPEVSMKNNTYNNCEDLLIHK